MHNLKVKTVFKNKLPSMDLTKYPYKVTLKI